MIYGYDNLLSDLQGIKKFSIGKTTFGRDIFAVIVGTGKPCALIHGGIHARESITSYLCVNLLKNYRGKSVCFVPMVNPDGVMLCKYGINSAPTKYRGFLKQVNKIDDFKLWKANGRAVDLNVNFDADWGSGKSNVTYPHFENYIGPYPFSECESVSLKNLTESFNFTSSISLHSKGDVIYYGYKLLKDYINYVKIISSKLNYPYEKTPFSCGGYKDWFLKNNFGFGITIEVGNDSLHHPIEIEDICGLYEKFKNLPTILQSIGEELWMNGL